MSYTLPVRCNVRWAQRFTCERERYPHQVSDPISFPTMPTFKRHPCAALRPGAPSANYINGHRSTRGLSGASAFRVRCITTSNPVGGGSEGASRRLALPGYRSWASRRLALPGCRSWASRRLALPGLCITHMSRCVRLGCKHSPWRRLPACVEAFLSTAVRCWL